MSVHAPSKSVEPTISNLRSDVDDNTLLPLEVAFAGSLDNLAGKIHSRTAKVTTPIGTLYVG